MSGLAALGLILSACQGPRRPAPGRDFTGVYALVSVDGKPVPASLSHQEATLLVSSGVFTIRADGTCGSRMTFVPPSGTEVTREVSATYASEGSKLTMQWKGAGRTVGIIDGHTFTMVNEGMVLVYRRQ